MSTLFESSVINKLQIPNRFIRSATWEGMADPDGAVTETLIETLVALAEGEVGLIIAGHAYVSPEGQATPKQLGMYTAELLPGLRQLTAAVHDQGGRIAAQLAHAGNFAPEKLIAQPPWVVSDYEGPAKSPRHEITAADIKDLVTAFAAAAGRAKDAGFDAVQLHSAHGYLLSQFLSPIFNRRRDEYGGSIANRARIHVEIVRAIREAVGPDFPVLIKMNCQDFTENGLTVEDSIEAADIMAKAGLDAIELSGGLLTGGIMSPTRPNIDSQEKEAYFSEELRAFRKAIHLPLILVGGIRSFEIAQRLVKDGLADYIAMSRPFIREPGLIKRWRLGDRRRAECKSDNLCFKPAFAGQGIYCVTAAREDMKSSQA
jgi:2,4-dienoyl-CoA reductase-like NADH-dependent reductase (Old Yellow Enzyme family)